MGVNSPLTEHNGTRRHSGSLGDIVSSGLHSPCRRIERLHCTRPAGWMEGGLRGERQRKREQHVCLSVSAEGARGRGNRGRRRRGGVAKVVALGVFCPMALDLFVSGGKKIKGENETKRDIAINITQAAVCRAKEALKGVGTQTERGRHGGTFMGGKKRSGFVCCFRV